MIYVYIYIYAVHKGFMLYRARNLYYCLFISFQNFRLTKQWTEAQKNYNTC